MFELEDGSLGTLAAPAAEPPKVVSYHEEAKWTPVGGSSGAYHPSLSGLTYPPAWQAIRQISGDGSSLDCNLYERTEEGDWSIAETNPQHLLMTFRPNNIQTPSIFKETLWHHALWLGDGRAAIIRDGNGMPVELIPLLPDRTWTILIADQATRITSKFHTTNIYSTWGTRGQGRQQFINPRDQDSYLMIPDSEVFHFQGLSFDGISGYNVSRMFQRTMGIGTSADGKIEVTLNRSGIPPLVLKAPPGVFKTEEEAAEFLRNWNEYHAGILNSGKTGLLRQGIEPAQLAGSNRDEQFEELKKLTRQDAAAIWNMPVQMLGDTDAATLNNVEQMFKWYGNRTFKPWAVKWDQEACKKLLSERQKTSGRFRFRYDLKPLQFVDVDSRARYYDSLRKNNAASGDDIREMEGLPRVRIPETTSYANPNTSSAASEPTTSEDSEPQASEFLKIRCAELAKVECDRLRHAADCVNASTFARRVDKQLGEHAKTLERVATQYGGQASGIAGYLSKRKDTLLNRMVEKGSHASEPIESESDLAGELYTVLFGSNGHAIQKH